MSDTPLSNIQEIIERSLFERIRLELVDKGYLPDITAYPDNSIGWGQWAIDIDSIATNIGFAIELFNAGNNQSLGEKKIPRIVIVTGNFLPGALGGDPQRYFEDQGPGQPYKALIRPPQTTDFYINFHLVANSIAQMRILNSILALSVQRRGYVPWYNDPAKTFFSRYLNYYNNPDPDFGLMEHIYAYEIPDCWETEDIELYDTAKINEITLNINIQKYMVGSWGYDTDSMVIT